MDRESKVVLHVASRGGVRDKFFDNWLSVSFNRSVEGVVGSATLTLPYTNRFNFNLLVDNQATLFLAFDDLMIHQTPLMTGYVRKVRVVHKAEGPLVTITVRDKTIDLEECHPITSPPKGLNGVPYSILNPSLLTPANMVNMTLGAICRAFCTPLGIDVYEEYVDLNLTTQNYETDESQTVFSQIAFFCRKFGVTPTTDARGRLVLGQMAYQYRTVESTSVPHSIEYMENHLELGNPGETWNTITHQDVLEATYEGDFSQRFSDYKVTYNSLEPGSPWGEGVEAVMWSRDGGVRRWRPKYLRPNQEYKGDKAKYADWISQTQRGNASSFTVKLRYWYKHQEGSNRVRIFEIGQLVNLNLPNFGWVGELVITSVDYQLDGYGARTLTLILKSKYAYAPAPLSNAYFDWVTGENVQEATVARTPSMYEIGPMQGPQPVQEVEQYEREANSAESRTVITDAVDIYKSNQEMDTMFPNSSPYNVSERWEYR